MSGLDPRTIRVGARIGENLTVLQRLNRGMDDPVLLVWSHRDWCPIVCKMFRSLSRARREAKALTSLNHPNIVRCLGVQEPDYVLMEYLDGRTLGTVIEERPSGCLSVSDAIRVAIHLGAALEHIHAKGFVHLDVKPANVMIVHGRPVLFDFGSLRERGVERPAQVHGTDPYIAPEEWRLEATDTAADVFSLGVTIYEMLTGDLPFGQSSKRHAQRPTDFAGLFKGRSRISRRLSSLVLQCLEPEPHARPALSVLLPLLHGEIRSGPRMWPEEQAIAWLRPQLGAASGAC